MKTTERRERESETERRGGGQGAQEEGNRREAKSQEYLAESVISFNK